MLNIDLASASVNTAPYAERLAQAHTWLQEATGRGSDFVGWVNLPRDYDKEEFARIQAAAKKIQSDSRALVVIGIGGSYLGARAAIELLRSNNYNLLEKDTPNIYFTGNGLSGDSLQEVMDLLGDQDFSVNVISKSGTTTEPAVAFRFFKAMLEKKYGKAEAAKRIYATTDKARGALKSLADAEGYETFVVPDDVGGRYSVLTAVGLLPIAVAGVDLEKLMAGAADMMETCRKADLASNPAWQYAAARSDLYAQGKKIEILAGYEPRFRFFAEWWKQLYGESEGKENKGLFPASVEFTADLHSMGQYIQQGERHMFETVVRFGPSRSKLQVPYDEADGDGLNFLAGKDMDFIATQAMDGTLLAHVEGGVPNLIVRAGSIDAYTCGELIYFFEYACGLSGYLLGVNPFDQPGVEAYKKNMFALLGKPGYEEMGAALREKLGFDKEDFVVLFCGRTSPEKGVHQLLAAMANIPDEQVKLLVVGSPFFGAKDRSDYAEGLQKQAETLGGRVKFAGFVPNPELPAYYRMANAACFPALWQEPAGITAIEAMACGCPVIATASGGLPEYLEGSGAVILPQSEVWEDQQLRGVPGVPPLEKTIAEAILALKADPARAAAMAKAGREAAGRYSPEAYYHTLLAALKD